MDLEKDPRIIVDSVKWIWKRIRPLESFPIRPYNLQSRKKREKLRFTKSVLERGCSKTFKAYLN
jgi:hypothetical protein